MKKRWSLLLLLSLLLTECSAAAFGGGLIPAEEGSGTYSEALLPFLSGYSPQEAKDTLYAEISRGNVVACFDVQAIPAIERGVGRYWYPMYRPRWFWRWIAHGRMRSSPVGTASGRAGSLPA